MHYVFEMQCPHCGAETQTIGTKQTLPPNIRCSTDNTEIIIVRVHVVAGQDGVDMLHYINGQRSKDHDDHADH